MMRFILSMKISKTIKNFFKSLKYSFHIKKRREMRKVEDRVHVSGELGRASALPATQKLVAI